ncbi:lasso peptide biosynthesis PqqD family chaperone [Clostridium akagii]|uniref:lasso peptide biosynthesis PqqD family chaperone n=1 Tax=Clostridium akagii TaxID=91623 RepID=UPI00047D235D|nr:lasso peptide biosynthesis PqqD family chaperone [Clostridium akagii]
MSKENSIYCSTIIVQKKGLDTTDLDGEVVMMDIDKGKYYNFNPVGSQIWKLAENPISAGEIILELLKQFDVDEKSCENSVFKFLERLLEDELITST